MGSLDRVLFGLIVKKYRLPIHKASLKLEINDLLDNSYFNLGRMSFRQLIGVSMGSDPAGFMANLFLKSLLQTKKWDMRKACIFSVIFTFIDDLYTLNNEDISKIEDSCNAYLS